MSLIDTITQDMYGAMKQKEKAHVATLRVLLSKLKEKQINQGKELSDNDGIAVIKTLVKQRKESIDMYEKAGRNELANAEKMELSVLETYLPSMMSDEDIRAMVSQVIDDTGASGMGDIGKVMPEVMKRGAGTIDGKVASQILRELLG